MSTPPLVTALILAGQRYKNDEVARHGGKNYKAFVELHGKAMILHVLDSLRKHPEIGRILISLPDDADIDAECPALAALIDGEKIIRVTAENRPSSSVVKTMEEHLDLRTPLLLTTCDHPLLTTDIVSSFLDGFKSSNADAVAALTPVDMIEQCYPGVKRTRMRFKDGDYTGCNLFAFKGAEAIAAPKFWMKLDQNRKKPWMIAVQIGLDVALLYLLKRLTLNDVLRRLGDKIEARLSPVILMNPHAGIDVDTIKDYELVSQIMAHDDEQKQAAQA